MKTSAAPCPEDTTQMSCAQDGKLKRLLRYVKGTEDRQQCSRCLATTTREDSGQETGSLHRLRLACDEVTKKSTSGAVIMADGMRLHAQSRGQDSVALSSCEAEVVAASEGIKEAL